jgi:hypothetical protein
MMRPKIYPVLEDAVTEGVRLGYNRAFKHTDSPDEQVILDNLVDAVMLCITERFVFDDSEP